MASSSLAARSISMGREKAGMVIGHTSLSLFQTGIAWPRLRWSRQSGLFLASFGIGSAGNEQNLALASSAATTFEPRPIAAQNVEQFAQMSKRPNLNFEIWAFSLSLE